MCTSSSSAVQSNKSYASVTNELIHDVISIGSTDLHRTCPNKRVANVEECLDKKLCGYYDNKQTVASD